MRRVIPIWWISILVLLPACATRTTTEAELSAIVEELVTAFEPRWRRAEACRPDPITWECRAAVLAVESWIDAIQRLDNAQTVIRLESPLAIEEIMTSMPCVPGGTAVTWSCEQKELLITEGRLSREMVLHAWNQARPIIASYERTAAFRRLLEGALSGDHQSRRKESLVTGERGETEPGVPVYNENDCIGAVVNDVCHGSVPPIPEKRCYGEMLNGRCTGPMF